MFMMFEKVPDDSEGTCRRGYRMFTDDDLKRAHDWLQDRGMRPAVDRPFQGLTWMTDPVGVPVEFCASMDQSQNRMRRFRHAGARLVSTTSRS